MVGELPAQELADGLLRGQVRIGDQVETRLFADLKAAPPVLEDGASEPACFTGRVQVIGQRLCVHCKIVNKLENGNRMASSALLFTQLASDSPRNPRKKFVLHPLPIPIAAGGIRPTAPDPLTRRIRLPRCGTGVNLIASHCTVGLFATTCAPCKDMQRHPSRRTERLAGGVRPTPAIYAGLWCPVPGWKGAGFTSCPPTPPLPSWPRSVGGQRLQGGGRRRPGSSVISREKSRSSLVGPDQQFRKIEVDPSITIEPFSC